MTQGHSEAHIKLPGESQVSKGYEALTQLRSQNMAPNQLGVRCLRRGSLTSLPSDMICEQGWAIGTDLEHLEDKGVPRT